MDPYGGNQARILESDRAAARADAGNRARHGGALLLDLLAEHGVRHVFGVPGGQTLALYDAILDLAPAVTHVLLRDERSAAYAADSYARVTGQVGVCDVTVGPGAAKLPSGLGEALGASVPVIALISDLPARMAPHRYRGAASQALDQAALLAPVTKWLAAIPDAGSMPGLVRQAFRTATSGRPGPVGLLLPQDVLDGAAGPAAPRAEARRFGSYPAFRPVPEPADVTAAAQVLRRAARPFLLAGGGVMHSDAGRAVTALAQRLSAAVATTLTGKGAIAEDDPLSVGVAGSMGTSSAATAFAEADVVLLIGTKASGGATYGWTLPRADQQVVQLDIDPAELGRAFGVAAVMLGDARAGLDALLSELGDKRPGSSAAPGIDAAERPGCHQEGTGVVSADAAAGRAGGHGELAEPDRTAWRLRLAALTADWRAARDRERASDAVPVAPQRVLAALDGALGPADRLICDASLASGWGGVYFEQRLPGRRVLSPRGLAGLGYAVPAAIGAATGDPAARIVVLAGDGALGYAIGELATLAELALPVTVVVLNNRSLGWIRWYRKITFGRGFEQDDFADVRYADVASGFGLHAERVTDPAGLSAALAAALGAGRPALVDVVTEAWETPIGAHRTAVAQGAAAGYGG
ncbi:MAG: thiamine pyrophosphate-binding protein [Actinobacteria bacterium]|nr:thiamine pyrophosphate-binding protein [Actinomycetota bacterium]